MKKNILLLLITLIPIYSCQDPNAIQKLAEQKINEKISVNTTPSSLPIISASPNINNENQATNNTPIENSTQNNTPVSTPTSSPTVSSIPIISNSSTGSSSSSSTFTPITVIKVDVSNITLDLETGKNFTLTSNVFLSNGDINSSVDFSSSDPSIATVSDSGRVNALKKGSCTIRISAKQNNAIFKECIVNVKDAVIPVLIQINNASTINKVILNNTAKIDAIVKYSDGTSDNNITFKNTDNTIADLGTDGTIFGKKIGTTKITAISNKDNTIFADLNLDIITSPYIISTVIGGDSRGYSGNTIDLASAKINFPTSLASDGQGTIYFTDGNNNLVRKITADNKVIDIAGNGQANFGGDSGNPLQASFNLPLGIALDKNNANLYIADTQNRRIRKVNLATNIITTFAGDGLENYDYPEGSDATKVSFYYPTGVSVDNNGNVLIVDNVGHLIKKVDPNTGKITTIAGDGFSFATSGRYLGDNGIATLASFDEPYSVSVDSKNNLYVADKADHRIRKIDAITGIITTFAGTGIPGNLGDGSLSTNAQLNAPVSIVFDKQDNLYISEYSGNKIKKVNAKDGILSTIAGTGIPAFFGDGGLAFNAGLNTPAGLVFDNLGNLIFVDAFNNRIRKITF